MRPARRTCEDVRASRAIGDLEYEGEREGFLDVEAVDFDERNARFCSRNEDSGVEIRDAVNDEDAVGRESWNACQRPVKSIILRQPDELQAAAAMS